MGYDDLARISGRDSRRIGNKITATRVNLFRFLVIISNNLLPKLLPKFTGIRCLNRLSVICDQPKVKDTDAPRLGAKCLELSCASDTH